MSPTHHNNENILYEHGTGDPLFPIYNSLPETSREIHHDSKNKTCSSAHVLPRDLTGCKNTFFSRDIIANLHNQRLCANENPHGIIL